MLFVPQSECLHRGSSSSSEKSMEEDLQYPPDSVQYELFSVIGMLANHYLCICW